METPRIHALTVTLILVMKCLFISGFYYGRDTAITFSQAKAQCELRGLRLAVFDTQSEWEAGKAYLNTYASLYGSGKHVWIGLERDVTQASMVYKWIDGTTLSWGAFYSTPWKDGSTPVDDVTKACVKMEWGASLNWKHHSCDSTEDFLCEGFYMNPASVGDWSNGKSTCEGMGMKLASLKSAEINAAAIQYINIEQYSFGTTGDVWFGLTLTGGQYVYQDGTAVTSGVYGSVHNTYPWTSNEPNNAHNDFCIRLLLVDPGSFEWADRHCSYTYNFLCQAQFTPVTTTTTTTTTTTSTTTTTPTTTTTTPTTTTTTTTTQPPTTTTRPETTTKPWWFVEYSDDGKAIGANGKTFDKSQPPARFGVIGLAIGFSTFGFLTIIICLLWFCCIRNKEDLRYMEEEEEEKEKSKQMFTPTTEKPHGLSYIA